MKKQQIWLYGLQIDWISVGLYGSLPFKGEMVMIKGVSIMGIIAFGQYAYQFYGFVLCYMSSVKSGKCSFINRLCLFLRLSPRILIFATCFDHSYVGDRYYCG